MPLSGTTVIFGRNFNPNLVGFQQTSSSALFTFGNFEITTNVEPKQDRTFQLGTFSDPITLDTLGTTVDDNIISIENNLLVVLNYDRKNILNYAYFGSLREIIRVSIEQIILQWPASIYVRNMIDGVVKITVLDYNYNAVLNQATFKAPVSCFQNKFEIKYLDENSHLTDFEEDIDYRNLTEYYLRYAIAEFPYMEMPEYNLLAFTGSTDIDTGYVWVTTQGNPFSAATSATTASLNYHIKPQKQYFEEFFNKLDNLEYYLLDRFIMPRYTSVFQRPIESDNGIINLIEESFSWPYSDGYNIDIDTPVYGLYLDRLMQMADDMDGYRTNLIARFFTTNAVQEFDTKDAKITKLLQIYGREYDDIKRYIDGIAWANRVTYDGNENLPDQLIKNFARMLGWNTLSTVSENNLVNLFLGVNNPSIYGGYSRDLTPSEADIELWRRLILNTAWIWKGKGTRKVLEFLFRFIGVPDCLVDLDEHVYLVDGAIDYEQFKASVVAMSGVSVDMSQFPVDEDGLPNKIPNSSNHYFQMKGGWFTENLNHNGPYDSGSSYFDAYRNVGFKLIRVVDDKKSWVWSGNSGTSTLREFDFPMRQTVYTDNGSRLVLNSKEATLWLDPSKAIECDMYNYIIDYVEALGVVPSSTIIESLLEEFIDTGGLDI